MRHSNSQNCNPQLNLSKINSIVLQDWILGSDFFIWIIGNQLALSITYQRSPVLSTPSSSNFSNSSLCHFSYRLSVNSDGCRCSQAVSIHSSNSSRKNGRRDPLMSSLILYVSIFYFVFVKATIIPTSIVNISG